MENTSNLDKTTVGSLQTEDQAKLENDKASIQSDLKKPENSSRSRTSNKFLIITLLSFLILIISAGIFFFYTQSEITEGIEEDAILTNLTENSNLLETFDKNQQLTQAPPTPPPTHTITKTSTGNWLYVNNTHKISLEYPPTFTTKEEGSTSIIFYPKKSILNNPYQITLYLTELPSKLIDDSEKGRIITIDGNDYQSYINKFGEGNKMGSFYSKLEWIQLTNDLMIIISTETRTQNDELGNQISVTEPTSENISQGESILKSIKLL